MKEESVDWRVLNIKEDEEGDVIYHRVGHALRFIIRVEVSRMILGES